ncbi:fatty acid desaturase [Haliangium ochraceum DSM 14365]|uniref:Fatty acid desaturase n=2 Tax=Haliangium ochraceum TaxID=80816 RepID=D0LSN3_HALO1|nr:fatty acid desaturase [Haliangium ochraceum DSM 14365]
MVVSSEIRTGVAPLAQARSPQQVRALIRRAPAQLTAGPQPAHLLRLALLDWAAIAALWALMALTSAWMYPLWCLLVAGRMHGLGVIAHDAAHMPRRRWDASAGRMRALEWLTAVPLGTSVRAMRYHHQRHHRSANLADDPYFKPILVERPYLAPAFVLRFLLLPYFWFTRSIYAWTVRARPALAPGYARVFLQDPTPPRALNREVAACVRDDARVFAFLLLALALSSAFPGPLLFGYLLPVTLMAALVGYRFFREHSVQPARDRQPASVLAVTRDHSTSALERLLLAPHNIGYHAVHHLHPGAGLAHLPALRRWYDEQAPGLLQPALPDRR